MHPSHLLMDARLHQLAASPVSQHGARPALRCGWPAENEDPTEMDKVHNRRRQNRTQLQADLEVILYSR